MRTEYYEVIKAKSICWFEAAPAIFGPERIYVTFYLNLDIFQSSVKVIFIEERICNGQKIWYFIYKRAAYLTNKS